MKSKIAALVICLVSTICLFAQNLEYNTRAYSIENGDPVLETSDGNLTLTITPQTIKYYDCHGNVESSHIQYQFTLYTKFLGMMSTIADQIISGKSLCLIKTIAQKTKQNMTNGGKEGLVIDNGKSDIDAFRIEVSEIKPYMMKRGWYMLVHTGRTSQSSTGYYTIGRKQTAEFIDALSQIEVDD